MIHMGLLQTRRDLTLEQNLQEVTKRVQTLRDEDEGIIDPAYNDRFRFMFFLNKSQSQ